MWCHFSAIEWIWGPGDDELISGYSMLYVFSPPQLHSMAKFEFLFTLDFLICISLLSMTWIVYLYCSIINFEDFIKCNEVQQNLLIRKFYKWERAFSQFVNWKFLEMKGHTLFLKMHIISSYNNKMKARLFCIFATGWTRTNNNFFGQNPWVSEQYNITPYGCYDRTLLDFVKGFRLPNSFHVFP